MDSQGDGFVLRFSIRTRGGSGLELAGWILERDFVGAEVLVADVPRALVEKFRKPARSVGT